MSFLQLAIGTAISLLLSLNPVLSAKGLVGNTIHTTWADCATVSAVNCIAAQEECTTPSHEECTILGDEALQVSWQKSAEGKRLLAKVAAQKQKWKIVGNEFWCSDPSVAEGNHVQCRQEGKQRNAAGCGFEWTATTEKKGTVHKNGAKPFLLPTSYKKSDDGRKLYVCVQDKTTKTKLTAETYSVDFHVDEQIAKLNELEFSAA